MAFLLQGRPPEGLKDMQGPLHLAVPVAVGFWHVKVFSVVSKPH